jgi:hypothetical protein
MPALPGHCDATGLFGPPATAAFHMGIPYHGLHVCSSTRFWPHNGRFDVISHGADPYLMFNSTQFSQPSNPRHHSMCPLSNTNTSGSGEMSTVSILSGPTAQFSWCFFSLRSSWVQWVKIHKQCVDFPRSIAKVGDLIDLRPDLSEVTVRLTWLGTTLCTHGHLVIR